MKARHCVLAAVLLIAAASRTTALAADHGPGPPQIRVACTPLQSVPALEPYASVVSVETASAEAAPQLTIENANLQTIDVRVLEVTRTASSRPRFVARNVEPPGSFGDFPCELSRGHRRYMILLTEL